jgi:hypothetical protein
MAEQGFLPQFASAVCLINQSEQREQLWFQLKDFLLGRGRNAVQFPDGIDFGELKNSFDDTMNARVGKHFLNRLDGNGQQLQSMFQQYCEDNGNSESNSGQSSISQSSSIRTIFSNKKGRRTLRKRKNARKTRKTNTIFQ